jgi:hypothetical protein
MRARKPGEKEEGDLISSPNCPGRRGRRWTAERAPVAGEPTRREKDEGAGGGGLGRAR